MDLVANAHNIAHNVMQGIDPSLAVKYKTLISFLLEVPAAAPKLKSSESSIYSEEYISRLARSFASARNLRAPNPPQTVPDKMVSVILHEYFDCEKADLEKIRIEHALSMGAENLVGDLLERYLASIIEPLGWVWCSGSTTKAVDFIKSPELDHGKWRVLQVKNRDNSENSSSSAIRAGTNIEKWFRTFSKKEGSNWGNFPDKGLSNLLSEEKFQEFVIRYLKSLRQ
ncbi:MAG: SinI family restriction endonuclease [Pseudomonadota bacterium]